MFRYHSDDKWWRGETQISKGLFPVNFVSTDLNASPEPGLSIYILMYLFIMYILLYMHLSMY